jgi:steroid 5-alpha reductase family enzyme
VMDFSVVIYSLLVSILFMSITFFVAWIRRRFDLIDVAWGMVFMAIAIVGYLAHGQDGFSVQSTVTLLVIVWGVRLSLHIYLRWKTSDSEDKRYAALRSQYMQKRGGLFLNMYCRVYLLQALLAVIVLLPVILVNADVSTEPDVWTAIGAMVWTIGFYFEAVGDFQLRRYLSDPKNKGTLMTSGVWKYTRHPNYFGEITMWWGIFIIAAPIAQWYITIIGPLVITVLLLFVSGVPLTEKHFEKRKGWKEYRYKTSKILPMPPKKV